MTATNGRNPSSTFPINTIANHSHKRQNRTEGYNGNIEHIAHKSPQMNKANKERKTRNSIRWNTRRSGGLSSQTEKWTDKGETFSFSEHFRNVDIFFTVSFHPVLMALIPLGSTIHLHEDLPLGIGLKENFVLLFKVCSLGFPKVPGKKMGWWVFLFE